uniref:Uncharacterized protein n=1 Tax=Oryza sativa subsp. japonica TaxID=39947 RepID=Q10KI7_ORYSJ|nr:hypothetical protein LOC_Os03g26550 [Oryza sativa Japonica Group]
MEGHVCMVVHDGDQRILTGGSDTSGDGMNRSVVVFNRETTRHGVRVDAMEAIGDPTGGIEQLGHGGTGVSRYLLG